MTTDLGAWLARERRQWLGLVTVHGDTLFDDFDDLAIRTERVALDLCGFFLPYLDADSTFTPPWPWRPLPGGLDAEWRDYGVRWRAFLDRNPRARLASMLSEISESHDAASWPYGWEDRIRDWVRSGFFGERPFQDAWRLDSPAWRRKLAETADEAGEGWVYYDDQHRLVWRRLPDFPT